MKTGLISLLKHGVEIMIKNNIICFSLVFLLLCVFVDKSFAHVPAQASKNKKNIKLFNGKNLEGWYIFLKGRGINNDPKKVFTIKNKTIRISGEEWGCITTNEEFENYTIEMDFKWGEKTYGNRATKAKDSGLLLHSQGVDGGASGIWMHSIEYNIIEGGTGDFIVVGDKTDNFSITSNVSDKLQNGVAVFHPDGKPITINKGRINWLNRDPNWRDELGFRGKNDVEKPVGQWNKVKCIVKGDKITSYLNDILVNEGYHVKPSRGRIQIQSEGAELFVRKIILTPLSN